MVYKYKRITLYFKDEFDKVQLEEHARKRGHKNASDYLMWLYKQDRYNPKT